MIRTRAPAAVLVGLVAMIAPTLALPGPVADPVAALAGIVDEFAADVGVPLDSYAALYDSGLDPQVATSIGLVLEDLHACASIAAAHAPDVMPALANGAIPSSLSGSTAPAWVAAMRGCGEGLVVSLDALAATLASVPRSANAATNLWPILYHDPAGTDTTYVHDFVLIVDEGGDDEYYNNAGGSVIDVLRGPAGSGATLEEPARSCQNDQELDSGNCVFLSAAVLELAGDDTYGRFESPGPADLACTTDPIQKRFAGIAAGVTGAGVIIERGGDDNYTGRTLAVGLGHAGGFGYLRDEAGDDNYTAIRSSIGAGVLFGYGQLDELAGDDVYSYYMPSGGVVDNNGDCNDAEKQVMGVGLLSAVGTLHDHAGDDTYNAPPLTALGGGTLAGAGFFLDSGGDDTYSGPAGRANGATVLPDENDQGLFRDEN